MEPNNLANPDFSQYIDTIVQRLAERLITNPPVFKAYYSLKEAAKYTSSSTDFIMDAIRDGRLVASDLGTKKKKMWRVSRENLDLLISQHEVQPTVKVSESKRHANSLPPSKYWTN